MDQKGKVLTQTEDQGLSLPENRGPCLFLCIHLQGGPPHLPSLCVCPVLALGRYKQNCVDPDLQFPRCGVSPVEIEVVFWALCLPAVRTWARG